jgi:tRNA (uracil-5-)-methyltransferase
VADLSPDLVPQVGPTIASPLQYGYRTKLTPHFDAPKPNIDLAIGFLEKGRRRVVDIEECPIATKTINEAIIPERQKIKTYVSHLSRGEAGKMLTDIFWDDSNVTKFKRGATLLLRHSLPPRDSQNADEPVCITNHHEIVRERVGDKDFEFNAGASHGFPSVKVWVAQVNGTGSFFQNNNSVLFALVGYVRSHIPGLVDASSQYLIDAYCGSGLFSIMLADRFTEVAGVEISADSVKYAEHNSQLNNISNAKFIVGNAEAIFEVGSPFTRSSVCDLVLICTVGWNRA